MDAPFVFLLCSTNIHVECLAIDVGRRMNHKTVLDTLCELFIHRGAPQYIRSDGPEFVAQDLRDWLDKVDMNTAYIEPGSPWENGTLNCSMPDYAMNYSMGEFSIRCLKLKYSSNDGAFTTTLCGHTAHSMDAHQHPKHCPIQRASQSQNSTLY